MNKSLQYASLVSGMLLAPFAFYSKDCRERESVTQSLLNYSLLYLRREEYEY
jgi:hypothetical protein